MPVAGRGQRFSYTSKYIELSSDNCWNVDVMEANDWVVFSQAVMLYTLTYIWLLGLSTGVTSVAPWRHRMRLNGSSQTDLHYVV